jgi:hypothetical protein
LTEPQKPSRITLFEVQNGMALGKQVQESLKEAEASLRNALAFAARQERPIVCTQISKMINEIEHIGSFDGIMDKLEEMTNDKEKF